MADEKKFLADVDEAYSFSDASLILGAPLLNGQCYANHLVKVPLRTLNRHGLIAGATGTGKTKSLQLIAENLSANGVPTLLMDIKGDLSGIAEPGTSNSNIEQRAKDIGIKWNPQQFPVELLTISDQAGVKLRATVSEFGPVLFSKILDLNDTQESVVSLLFKYSDDKQLPLLDLADMKALLQYVTGDGKAEVTKLYGAVSTSTVGIIQRKIIELEQQGAGIFFGEPSFDPHDLMRTENGKGCINILRVNDIQNRPKLFSTFVLSLLAEIFGSFPEVGDPDKPKLVIFCDEAHLFFDEATKELLSQIETTVKLIRSKGVGIFFITQNPQDIPASVLSQLGLKVQHALRAFTAADRKAIQQASQNFPLSDYYKTDQIITELGIGEALVTALNEKGQPTMLVDTRMCPPSTRMDVLADAEINSLVSKSQLASKYNQTIDKQSAFEILQQRMQGATTDASQQTTAKQAKPQPTTFDQILKSPVVRSVGIAVAGTLTRTILGSLGLKTRSSRRY